MQQLKQPDLNTVGRPHLCLQFVRTVFGVPAKYGYATEAWQKAKYKHTDTLPTVAVPVWFSWTGTVEGIRKNWGHVAVWVPARGILSDPLQGANGSIWLPSIQTLQEKIGGGAKYLGWSEDINDVRVAQGGDMIARGRAIRLLRLTRRGTSEAKIQALMKKDEDTWLDEVYNASWFKEQSVKLNSPTTVNKASVVEYINQNLK